MAGPSALVARWRECMPTTFSPISWAARRMLLSWPAPKPQYAPARAVGIGQARRWSTLSALARLKQERFTI